MESKKYLEGQSMQRPPLFESDGFIYWKNRFETYVKSKDLDLWHVITDGDFPLIQNIPETKKDEVVPFHKQNDDLKNKLAKNNEAKMVIYNALPHKEYERIFMCQTAKEIWDTLLITHQGRISGKGKIKTGTLDFDDVYFCKELKYNLFSVSQICDKKNNVLFTDTGCLVLSSNFKLLDESQVLLRVPRKDNIYSVDLKSVFPTGGLTCLFAKATTDESNLWYKRLGHINYKTMNKLVRGNLNGVAKRKNRTLIDAARTMLVDSKLPTTFWAETVNTACYVLNRALVIKPHNKTPYELIRGRPPLIDLMKPFGCPVTILNTRDYLGKFDENADEGFFVRYSVVRFQTNGIAGTKDNIIIGQAKKKKEPEQEYILIPICTTDPLISQGPKDSALDAGKKATETEHINNTNSFNTVSLPVNTAGPSFVNAASPSPINAARTPAKEEVDMNNVVSSYTIPDAPLTKFLKDHPKYQIFVVYLPNGGDVKSALYGKNRIGGYMSVNTSPAFEDLDFLTKYTTKVEKRCSHGLHQAPRACQDKYVADILNFFEFSTVKTSSTPMEPNKALIKDAEAEDVDVHLYKSMIGSLMYLTASRPDIIFAVCACARFQVTPKTSHLYAMKRIFYDTKKVESFIIPLSPNTLGQLRMAKKAELNNGLNRNSGQREIRPIWNNVQRVNKQNQFVPIAVLTRTGKILVNTARASNTKNVSTARHSFNRQAVLTISAVGGKRETAVKPSTGVIGRPQMIQQAKFKNKDVIEFCGSKGIKRDYSNARTPQQNGVAERKNMTLIEAARQEKDANDAAESRRTGIFIRNLRTLYTSMTSKASITKIFSPYDGLSLSDPTNHEQDDSEIPSLEYNESKSTNGNFYKISI
ncbi:ribonuclease H-like domain-containing protein [Tanacetum coccineum]|uniref:Ribonuclease H-like domain-containing protein n=1 Tax=Tanacetum coccineum TaxID=301880 RepID=A0ABQ5ACL3_9ASTR